MSGKIRCKNKPNRIVSEIKKGKDGLKGSMSMCNECFVVFTKQVGIKGYKIKEIKEVKDENT